METNSKKKEHKRKQIIISELKVEIKIQTLKSYWIGVTVECSVIAGKELS